MSKLRYKEGGIWKSIAPSQKEFDDNKAEVTAQLADMTKVTVASVAPANPSLNDVWVDISYTPVLTTSPANNGYKPKDGGVTFTFDKWLDDSVTGKLKVYPTDADRTAGTNEIAGTLTRVSNKKITFKPTINLTPQSTYYVRLFSTLLFVDGYTLPSNTDLQFKAIDFINANFESWDATNLTPTGWVKTVSGTTTTSIVELVDDADRGGKVVHLKAGNAAGSNAVILKQRLKKIDILSSRNVSFAYKPKSGNAVDKAIYIEFEFRNSGDTGAQLRVSLVLNGNPPVVTASAKYIDLRSQVVNDAWKVFNVNFQQFATDNGFNHSTFNDCDVVILLNANTANAFLECYIDDLDFKG